MAHGQSSIIRDASTGMGANVNSSGKLEVDTELTLSGDVTIENVTVARNDAGQEKKLRVDASRNLYVTTSVNLPLNVSGDIRLKDADSATFADVELDSAKNALFVQSESLASELTVAQISGDSADINRVITGLSGDFASALDSISTDELRVVLADDTTPANKAQVYDTGAVRVSGDVNIVTGDIQIGAVELKDGDSATRADIETDGTKNALFVQSNTLASKTIQALMSGDTADIKTAVEVLDNAISGTEMQVDVVGGALQLGISGDIARARDGIEIMDDWDESDRAKVNLIAGQVGVQGASGDVNALTQRVTIAQNDGNIVAIKTAVETVDNAISGNEILIAGGGTQTNDVKVTLANEKVVIESGDTHVEIWNGSEEVGVDDNCLAVATHEHYLSHQGTNIGVHRIFEDLANGTSGDVLIHVGASALNCDVLLTSEGEFLAQLREGVTVAASGNALTPYNKKRKQAHGLASTFFYGATVSGGTQINGKIVGSGKDEAGDGGMSNWILESGEDYVVSMKNRAGANKSCSINLRVHEG